MSARMLILAALAAAAVPAYATTVVSAPQPVPGLGLLGVAATGVVALVIGWWRMRK